MGSNPTLSASSTTKALIFRVFLRHPVLCYLLCYRAAQVTVIGVSPTARPSSRQTSTGSPRRRRQADLLASPTTQQPSTGPASSPRDPRRASVPEPASSKTSARSSSTSRARRLGHGDAARRRRRCRRSVGSRSGRFSRRPRWVCPKKRGDVLGTGRVCVAAHLYKTVIRLTIRHMCVATRPASRWRHGFLRRPRSPTSKKDASGCGV